MAKEPLKNRDNAEQMKTVLRASKRVSSWPEWKRSTTLYRCSAAPEERETTRASSAATRRVGTTERLQEC
jgi:hypothetical protein